MVTQPEQECAAQEGLCSSSSALDMQQQRNATTFPKVPSHCWKSGAKYCILVFCCLNVVMLFIGGLWPALTGSSLHKHKEIIIIQTDHLVHVVSDKFLSVALDSSLISRKWDKLDFRSESLKSMAAELSPCYLRLGGTAADRLIFQEHEYWERVPTTPVPMDGGDCANEGEGCTHAITNFTMSGQDFINVNKFARDAGMQLLFDLNVLLRKDQEWEPSNAAKLIQFAYDNNFNIAWQLGNEPNAFRHVFDVEIAATQLGRDFLALRQLLKTFPRYHDSELVGPDVTRPRLPENDDLEFLREFLRVAGPQLSAITWHQYYLNGREATLQDFLNIDVFNELHEQIALVKHAVRTMALKTPIWLGETSTAYGGGAPNLSDRFVAGFLWLDKLGVAASQSIDVVVRQTLYGGHYGIVNDDMQPNPDFWVSALHKTLVGRGVIGVSQLGSAPNSGPVRIYCHCTASEALLPGLGALTLFGLNLRASSVELSLQGPHNVSSVDSYILRGETGLESRYVLLNDKRLELLPNGQVPRFKPESMDLNAPIMLPAYSMGFWVLHGAQVPMCQQHM